MSSSMLEQAIIDAEELKEAAIKNAEQAVLEKYSTDIKKAVETLLEQEEDELFADDEMDSEGPEDIVNQLEMSALDGEKACECPPEDEPIVLDLDQIVAAAEAEAPLDLGAEEEIVDSEEDLFEVNDENLLETITKILNEEESDKDYDGDGKKESPEAEYKGSRDKAIKKSMSKEEDEGKGSTQKGDFDKTNPKKAAYEKGKIGGKVFEDSRDQETAHYITNKDADKKEIEDLEKDEDYDDRKEERRDENLDLDENLVDEIVERLIVDMENVPSGEMFHTHPTMGQNERGLEIALASEQDTEFAEEQEELRQALKKLQEQVKSQTLKMNKQKKDLNNLKSIAIEATKKLEEVNFSNAKLIYTNRILKSDSLNERQKEKLAEAISKVGSVEEAKIVFETLEENLSPSAKKAPNSLKEAVSKNNRLILKSNKEEKPAGQNQVNRLRRLAGII